MVAIDAFNENLRTNGHFVLAGGLAAPQTARVIDYRDETMNVTDGAFASNDEFLAGLWIIVARDLDEAQLLAAKASKACQRKIEVRAFY